MEGSEKAKQKEKEKEFDAKAEFAKLTNTRSGGVYVPPARLRAMQAAASQDKSSAEYQRITWDALRKSITGIVNRVNIANIKQVVPELFSEDLIRGRGLFARSVMKAQAASLPFTPVFAALVAIINTKLPQVGELVVTRLISQFRRAYKRNDKVSSEIPATMRLDAHTCWLRSCVIHQPLSLLILSTKPSCTSSSLSKYSSCCSLGLQTTLLKSLSASCEKLGLSSRKTHQKQTRPCLNVFVPC